ncbi:MAG: Cobyric acid synthase [Desulfovibrio sp.]
MTAKPLMVQGTASSAGKSALVTALCRIYARRGFRVAPFKAQNMALNSYVTPEGGEIGRSQAAQAEACGIQPSTDMNPVLLKPNSDRRSQVIVNGRVRTTLDAKEYYAFRHTLQPEVRAAYARLAAVNDIIIIEGAGSPAEINLRENDLVNMGMAAMADAPVLLVADIDRGGVFASLYGTAALLAPEERARITGFVINKFRGDVSILEPGLDELEKLTGIPTLGVLPYWQIPLDEEDSLAERLVRRVKPSGPDTVDIAVLKLPRLSNFTDFAVFDLFDDVRLRYVETDGDLGAPDMVILPGSKNTVHDLAALEKSGMADAVRAYHASGGVVAGICGGFQMLGTAIADPGGVESGAFRVDGLGLLDMHTVFAAEKRTVRVSGTVTACPGVLAAVSGLPVEGYEIHMGRSSFDLSRHPFLTLATGELEGAVSPDGRVFGTYMHGVFDSVPVARALANGLRALRGLPERSAAHLPATYGEYRRAQYDALADIVEAHLNMDMIDAIIWGV